MRDAATSDSLLDTYDLAQNTLSEVKYFYARYDIVHASHSLAN